jgi:hypothetical protein
MIGVSASSFVGTGGRGPYARSHRQDRQRDRRRGSSQALSRPQTMQRDTLTAGAVGTRSVAVSADSVVSSMARGEV